jgi:hypothetical protein
MEMCVPLMQAVPLDLQAAAAAADGGWESV